MCSHMHTHAGIHTHTYTFMSVEVQRSSEETVKSQDLEFRWVC